MDVTPILDSHPEVEPVESMEVITPDSHPEETVEALDVITPNRPSASHIQTSEGHCTPTRRKLHVSTPNSELKVC